MRIDCRSLVCSTDMSSLLDVDIVFFFFKQKTAYEMRISDWSSDVCSSDLRSRQQHHRDMNEEKGHERPGGDEMDRARRLAPAEDVGEPRPGGVHSGRHGEPRRDHQRPRDENDADIDQLDRKSVV